MIDTIYIETTSVRQGLYVLSRALISDFTVTFL